MSFYAVYPVSSGGGGGVPTYPDTAAFPSAITAGDGALAIALDTNILYESDGTSWIPIAGPSGVFPIFTANRAVITSGAGALAVATTTSTEIGYVNGVTSAIQTQLNNKQPLDGDLTAIAALTTTGLAARTATDTWTTRTITAGSTKLAVTNGGGVAANPTVDLGDITGGTGIVVETAASTYAARSVVAGSTKLAVTNGSGVAGNPSVDLGDITGSTGLVAETGASTYSARTITAGSSKISVTNGGGVAGNPTVDAVEANFNLANLGGTAGIGQGGTGQTTKAPAFNALSPMTTAGDIIYGGASGTGTRLAAGTATQVLHGGTTPSWSQIVNGDIDAAAAIGYAKLAGITRAFVGTVSNSLSTASGGTFTNFSPTLSLSITPTFTGAYFTFVTPIVSNNTNSVRTRLAVNATTGSPTSLFNQDIVFDDLNTLTGVPLSFFAWRLDTLTAATNYVFNLQAVMSGGTCTLFAHINTAGIAICSIFLGS